MPPFAEETDEEERFLRPGKPGEADAPLTWGNRRGGKCLAPKGTRGGRNPRKLSNFQSLDRKSESSKLSGAWSFDGLIELSICGSKVRNF